jgi:hypothetical protein
MQTITGTTDSTDTTNDFVDLFCVSQYVGGGNRYFQITTNLPLNPDGSFSYTGPVAVNGSTCTVRAVPNNLSLYYASMTSYAGPFSELDRVGTDHVTTPTSAQYDYGYTASGINGVGRFSSAGDCPVGTFATKPGTNAYGDSGWNCAAALPADDNLGSRSNILIDGRNAYTSYGASNAYSDGTLGQGSGEAAGFPALTSSYNRSATTSGDATISEGQGLVSCANASFPASQAKCGGATGSSIGSWQSDGVSLSRTIQQSSYGQLETVTDTYSSTDGTAHNIDVEYGNPSSFYAWKFPGSADYQAYGPGDSVSLAGNSIDAIYSGYSDSASNPNAESASAVIYTTQPSGATFNNRGDLLLDYQRQVPAGGSITITHLYVSGYDAAATSAAANGIVSQFHKPTVAITAPNNGTVTQQSTAVVQGNAVAHDGLGLKVDGQTVPVNSDGTWSTTVPLRRGANTVTAVATDGSGNAAQATDKVIYTPTPAPKFCIVPAVSHNRLAKAKTALKKANCKVGKIHEVRSSKFRKGTVEHASYSAHVVLKAGTKVGLTEVIGKPKKHKKH